MLHITVLSVLSEGCYLLLGGNSRLREAHQNEESYTVPYQDRTTVRSLDPCITANRRLKGLQPSATKMGIGGKKDAMRETCTGVPLTSLESIASQVIYHCAFFSCRLLLKKKMCQFSINHITCDVIVFVSCDVL